MYWLFVVLYSCVGKQSLERSRQIVGAEHYYYLKTDQSGFYWDEKDMQHVQLYNM